MATGDSSGPALSPDGIDPRSVLALPFVADVPDAGNPRKTTRKFWVLPAIPTDDYYGDACRIGARWAAQYIAWQEASGMPPILTVVMRDMAALEGQLSSTSGARCFAIGFLGALSELAVIGARACGGAARYGDLKEREHRELQAKYDERERAEISKRVSRMNTGRRAKRAQRDPHYQQFKAKLVSVGDRRSRNPVKSVPPHDA